ncbi:MAG: NAD(P)-binding protein [Acetobacteraceae bacterium]|nr:NAD(P)-binding protein [Acetobacteraceae bacterium]
MSATPGGRKRVAVLGGGIGALAAAYKLTQQPNWQDKFEITVHQLGWRLGGKGASARNTALGSRIEEHGLHVWAGFYENAFRLMNDAYEHRPPRPGSPIQTVQQAFLPESHVMLAEQRDDAWLPWPIYFAPQPGWPGDGSTPAPPDPAAYLSYVLDWLRQKVAQLPLPLRLTLPVLAIPAAIRALTPAPPPAGATPAERLLHQAHTISLLASAGAVAPPNAGDALNWLLSTFRAQLDALLGVLGEGSTELRRLFIVLDLLCSVALSIVAEGVLEHGFAVLDRYELTELLRKHGASAETLASPLVTSAYDYVFGYIGGDRARPSLSATSAAEGFLRLLFTYKRALFFKMAAGAGEIIFAPLYDVLKARGVRFEFFHRVLELVPQDGRIDAVRIAVQATPKPPATDYDPFILVGGLACWPAEPLYDQLANGDELRANGIDLEDDWQDYSIGEMTLRFGTDFDAVILGIPPGALATICAPLATPGSPWRRMLDEVETVSTQALQLWSDCTLAAFASPFAAPQPDPDPVGPVLTAFAPAFDTWSDMSHLLKHEDWGPGGPGNVAYFCAVLQDPPPVPPGGGDPQPGATAQVRANAVAWLNDEIGGLWPKAADPGGFRWDLLHAPAGASGEARLDAQYWRANVTGSERYVLSLPGTLDVRLPPGGSGFSNLYLAGDWAKVAAINAGCMEVAVMAGFGAAAALAGVPDDTYA